MLWAFVVGCGNGAIFPLMMTLPLDAADRPEQVAGVVGMMLGIGYCIGALAPLALGALRDGTGSFSAGLWVTAASSSVVGLRPSLPVSWAFRKGPFMGSCARFSSSAS